MKMKNITELEYIPSNSARSRNNQRQTRTEEARKDMEIVGT